MHLRLMWKERSWNKKAEFMGAQSRPLSKYEDTINACALICCEQDATLLKDRNRLFKLAKEKADSKGYQYKKRKSRSKVFGDGKETKNPKRLKLVTEERQKRQSQLAEDIKSSTDTMKLLELQREKFVNAEKYLQAAEMVTQISECRTKLRGFQAELTKLQKADSRSKKYHKGKRAISSSKVSPLTRATTRTSSSTSTEFESDVFIQDGLHERIEEPIEIESASISVARKGEMRLDMFCVSSSNVSPVASVDSKSPHSTSVLESGINIQKGLHESEDCIEVANSSITVAKKGEQSIDTSAIIPSKESLISSEPCKLSSCNELEVQEIVHEKSEEQCAFKQTNTAQIPSISKETLKVICDLASSEKDKRLIKYAVCQSSNISAETAKKTYGISDLKYLKDNVEDAIEQALEIRKAVDLLSSIKEACILE